MSAVEGCAVSVTVTVGAGVGSEVVESASDVLDGVGAGADVLGLVGSGDGVGEVVATGSIVTGRQTAAIFKPEADSKEDQT